MSWTFVNGYGQGAGTGSTASSGTITAPTDGDLVVAVIHCNLDNATISDTTGSGAAFNAVVDSKSDDMGAETATYSILWKVASSEPSGGYSFSLGSSTRWDVIVAVATPSEGTPQVDASPVFFYEPTSVSTADCSSINVSNDSIAFAFAGFDNVFNPDGANVGNSYTTCGIDGDQQTTVLAYRIFATGGASGTTTFNAMGGSDRAYTAHLSFNHGTSSSVAPLGGIAGEGGLAGMGGLAGKGGGLTG